jgi:hypothetical protein
MEKIVNLMDKIKYHCRENKIKIDLHATFKKGNSTEVYDWVENG